MAQPAAGAGATPGQGTPGTGVQPGAPGQGAGQGQSTAGQAQGQQQSQAAGFNWDLFPDVPADQREMLEPHLRGVQGHVTKLEQQYAPYKGLVDTVSPEQVSNLIGFLQSYNSDPMATFLGMAQELQQAGSIPGTVSMDALQALVSGQQVAQGQVAQPGEDVPAWAQSLQQRLDAQDQRTQQEAAARQSQEAEAQNAQALETAKANIQGAIAQAGIEAGTVGDEMIVAAIIACDGDEQAAGQLITGMRDAFLASFTKANTTGGAKPPAVQGKLPQAPKPGRRGDAFAEAKQQALQHLEQQAAMAAQG